jgi:FMN phosphatase YigB (HAD superfamily)
MDTSNIKTIIWDLDNTLYKFTEDQVWAWHHAAVNNALKSIQDLSREEALLLADKGWREHRNSSHFFENDYGLCPRETHINVIKNLDESIVIPCLETPNLISSTNYRHVILTYATRDWALRVLNHAGLLHLFDDGDIMGAENYDFEDKAYSPRGIQTALDKIGGNPQDTLFVEDTLPNLVTAKTHTGICTAYLHHGREVNDNDRNHLDIITQDTPELLKKWFKVPPAA